MPLQFNSYLFVFVLRANKHIYTQSTYIPITDPVTEYLSRQLDICLKYKTLIYSLLGKQFMYACIFFW